MFLALVHVAGRSLVFSGGHRSCFLGPVPCSWCYHVYRASQEFRRLALLKAAQDLVESQGAGSSALFSGWGSRRDGECGSSD